jgi:hypothetical protein
MGNCPSQERVLAYAFCPKALNRPIHNTNSHGRHNKLTSEGEVSISQRQSGLLRTLAMPISFNAPLALALSICHNGPLQELSDRKPNE